MQIDRCRFGKRKRGLMSKVIMMCGVCGSGKTTYAKKKEQEGYIRLSIDEEMWKLYGRKGIDYPEEQYEKLSEQVEAALQKKLLSLIQQGKDVVIDFSFWSKENRNIYKELIQKAGAETELIYMKASKELLQKRLYKRNQVLNANSPFVITDELLEHVCRHTYCSNMAKSGMNPKTLQYLMGHSDISVTMNVYTHIGFDDAEEELKRIPDIETGTKPIAFGDFSYYWIVGRKPVTVRTLLEKFVLYDQIGYLAFEFLDGKLVRNEAIKVIQMADAGK